MDLVDIYEKLEAERRQHSEAIIDARTPKKVIVAGPGTGKTFLFKEALKGKSLTLTLTFVNSLVEDLSLELYGLSDVKTLHGFGRSIQSSILRKTIKISPKLPQVIKEDALILKGEDIDFDRIFQEMDNSNPNIDFYIKRRQFYDYYGYSDVIYSTIRCFEEDATTIPFYEQVLVDEFQDFNKLEVTLIDYLATSSPILLAGDDDQALYEFKSATPTFIRERHGDKMPEYHAFNLPYCSRCPRVVVEATNDLIHSAKANGLLKDRIDKPFRYFNNKEKDKISAKYPRIIYKNVFAAQVPWLIEQCLQELAMEIRDKFSVLIISPFKKQCETVAMSLKEKGLNQIEYSIKTDEIEPSLMDGYRILLEDPVSNLGWRIVARSFLSWKDFVKVIKETQSNPSIKFHDCLPTDTQKSIKEILQVLKYISKDKAVNQELLDEAFRRFNIEPSKLGYSLLKEEIDTTLLKNGNPALRNIPIKSTTIQSSKGLSADVVFITHFDERYFISNTDKKQISDRDFCNFLVSLTRTKKKVFLISTTGEPAPFLNWIDPDKISRLR